MDCRSCFVLSGRALRDQAMKTQKNCCPYFLLVCVTLTSLYYPRSESNPPAGCRPPHSVYPAKTLLLSSHRLTSSPPENPLIPAVLSIYLCDTFSDGKNHQQKCLKAGLQFY